MSLEGRFTGGNPQLTPDIARKLVDVGRLADGLDMRRFSVESETEVPPGASPVDLEISL